MLKSLLKAILPPIITAVSDFLIDKVKNMKRKNIVEQKKSLENGSY